MLYLVAGNCGEAEYWMRAHDLTAAEVRFVTGAKMASRLSCFQYVLIGTYPQRRDWHRLRDYHLCLLPSPVV